MKCRNLPGFTGPVAPFPSRNQPAMNFFFQTILRRTDTYVDIYGASPPWFRRNPHLRDIDSLPESQWRQILKKIFHSRTNWAECCLTSTFVSLKSFCFNQGDWRAYFNSAFEYASSLTGSSVDERMRSFCL